MLKEDLEKAILYSNICLKRWAITKTHLINGESIRSMVNGWIIRVLCRTSYTEWRMSKSLGRNISRSLFVTVHPEQNYITSISVNEVNLPKIDFVDLHKQAEQLVHESFSPTDLSVFNLKSIETIKFN